MSEAELVKIVDFKVDDLVVRISDGTPGEVAKITGDAKDTIWVTYGESNLAVPMSADEITLIENEISEIMEVKTGEILASPIEHEQDIRRDYAELTGTALRSFELICSIGEHLSNIKTVIGHGGWADYVDEAFEERRLPFKTTKQAAKYIKISENREFLNDPSGGDLTLNELYALCADPNRALKLTSEIEWYTPPTYIDSARIVMGDIDLDPATSEYAQESVQAKHYFTVDDDGLTQEWKGRVWLNPPYKSALIRAFVTKLIESKAVTEAIMLTNNTTDIEWWHEARAHAKAICFHRGRIQFYQEGTHSNAPTHGQTIFYFGSNAMKFKKEFAGYGPIWIL